MSFITNMFGGKKKEKKPHEPTPEEIAKQKAMANEKDKFEQQKNLEALKVQQNKLVEKMDASQNKADQLEKEMMGLIQSGQKDKAKRLLKTVKAEKQKVVNFQNKEGFLAKQILTLEAVMDDSEITDVLKDTNKQLEKAQDKQNEF